MKVFTLGWMIVFALIFFMNIYIYRNYIDIPFKFYRDRKIMVYMIIHLILLLTTVFYFYLFFKGETYFKYINTMSKLAGFYISFLHYSVVFYLIYDLFYILIKKISFLDVLRVNLRSLFFGGFIIFALAGLIALFGLYNSSKLTTKIYSMDIARRESSLKNLNIVFLSDAHIGSSVNRDNIDSLVDRVEKLDPDLLILGGDLFDEGTLEADKRLVSRKLSEIKTKYGIYSVEGNHEYKSGNSQIESQMDFLRESGILVLQDEYIRVDNSFYIVGRKDSQGENLPLAEVLEGVEKDLPLILIDHRPSFKESREIDSVDLQVSGHSHSGQFAAAKVLNPLTARLFKQYVYGYHKIDRLNMVVSSGVGNWAIPVRIGSRREIVNIKVNFR